MFKTSLDLIKEKPKLIISWVTPLSINLGFTIDAHSSIKGLIESDKFNDRECLIYRLFFICSLVIRLSLFQFMIFFKLFKKMDKGHYGLFILCTFVIIIWIRQKQVLKDNMNIERNITSMHIDGLNEQNAELFNQQGIWNLERSTDLKNWKKLVKVNKGGFEVFVDPTEKNKEFFRVKSE